MKTTISNVKIGDRLPDDPEGIYGCYKNQVISNIIVTKAGRIRLFFDYTYVYKDGSEEVCKNRPYSNGALSPNRVITLKP